MTKYLIRYSWQELTDATQCNDIIVLEQDEFLTADQIEQYVAGPTGTKYKVYRSLASGYGWRVAGGWFKKGTKERKCNRNGSHRILT